MPLVSPNLDDRTFDQLMEAARARILQSCPEWTDLSPGDPGTVLLELFAYLTETMIFRLNQVPEKAYVEFLRLIGVALQPPVASVTTLTFSRSGPGTEPIEIPQGTRVAASRGATSGEPPVFSTAAPARIAGNQSEAQVLAYHATEFRGELLGTGGGLPGAVYRVAHPPIIAPTGDNLDLLVAIESEATERREGALEWAGKTYRIWRPVSSFAETGSDQFVYVVDRLSGVVTFGPAVRGVTPDGTLAAQPTALGEVVPSGKEVRAWYRSGGGSAGNVTAGMLTVLKNPVNGVSVTNAAPSTGGRDQESLSNALVRGPQELHSVERAVTARDFELIALRSSGGVSRARAVTTHDLWRHAQPGTVEVLLVPHVPDEQRAGGRVSAAALHELQGPEARDQIQSALDLRRPLGVISRVSWSRYKAVNTSVRVVVRHEEDMAAVRRRVEQRLYETINPLPGLAGAGWNFGEALRASHIYDIVLKEPGVIYADNVRLTVDEVPSAPVQSLIADQFQPRSWYAGNGPIVFRSLNHGDGWEPVGRFDGQQVTVVRVHATRPGLLTAVSETGADDSSTLHVSRDCGETWETVAQLGFTVRDAAWLDRDNTPALLLATDAGLYEMQARPGATPLQLVVGATDHDQGFYSVVVANEANGQVTVAVAAQQRGGTYLSSDAGRSESFHGIGLDGEDIRALAIQHDGPRSFLWAGVTAAAPDDAGKGCYRRELLGSQTPTDGWLAFAQGWTGGSCRSMSFLGGSVLAATHHSGVMRLDISQAAPAWMPPDIRCGLPLRDAGQFLFKPVNAVDVSPGEQTILAGSEEGVFRSIDGGASYQSVSKGEYPERVTLPETWLFCSGTHDVTVVDENETARN